MSASYMEWAAGLGLADVPAHLVSASRRASFG